MPLTPNAVSLRYTALAYDRRLSPPGPVITSLYFRHLYLVLLRALTLLVDGRQRYFSPRAEHSRRRRGCRHIMITLRDDARRNDYDEY